MILNFIIVNQYPMRVSTQVFKKSFHTNCVIYYLIFMLSVDSLQDIEPDSMPSPDFTMDHFDELAAEDNYDSLVSNSYPELDSDTTERFLNISSLGIVDVKGDDAAGRKIIVVYACKLPDINKIDHQLLLE